MCIRDRARTILTPEQIEDEYKAIKKLGPFENLLLDVYKRQAINRDFGSFENFKKEFNAASTGLFGSGWAWLSIDKQGKLHITKEPNGSNPWRAGRKPLLGFDVWEHAYYLRCV